jgi:WD40 repeat protein
VRVAFSPDGKTVASVGPDYRIQRWNSEGKPLGITDPPPGILVTAITGLTFADNERAIAWVTAHQFAVAWEAPTGKLLSPEMDHAAAIRSISFGPDGKDPYSSGLDGRLFRWDLKTGALNERITLHPARIPGQPLILPVVNVSADASRAVWARSPNSEVFDLTTGDNLFVVPPPSTPPAAVNINTSPDGMKLITLSRQANGKRSGSCVVWDLTTRQRVAEFDIPASGTALAPMGVLSPDGNRLVITTVRNADAKQVLVFTGYDLKTGKKLAEVEDPAATGTVSLGAADDSWVVAASTSGRVWAVDYATGQIGEDIDNFPVRGESSFMGPVVFSADGKRFATGVVGEPFTTYGVRVYDWPQRKALHTFIGHLGPITALRFAPDGNTLASGAQDTSVLVWDLSKVADGK